MPSLADLRMDSGRGMECRTMAPYSPYSAMTLLRPQHFSRFLHLALRFWNQTCVVDEQVCSERPGVWSERSLPQCLSAKVLTPSMASSHISL